MEKDQDRMEIVADFLQRVMTSETEDIRDRLKASELLAKTSSGKGEIPESIEIRIVYGD